jgi:acylphosphatase
MVDDLARVHIWVTGGVQGVGFRAFVASSARFIGVTGWVRNVGYETVEVVAEGTNQQMEQFIQVVKTGPGASYVNGSRVEQETPSGEFVDFEIRSSR